jgi:ABC-type glycerol-3-phosphate transport system permease component
VLVLFLSCMMVPFQATIIPAFRSPAVAVPRSLIDAAQIDGLAGWRIPARRALSSTGFHMAQVLPLAKARPIRSEVRVR